MATPIGFFKETADELKKVTWPTRKDVIRLTGLVILVSIIVGAFLGSLDFIFTKIIEIVIK